MAVRYVSKHTSKMFVLAVICVSHQLKRTHTILVPMSDC